MLQIEVYMEKSREERRSHLHLEESCDIRGGESKQFKGLLAYHLDTSIPSGHKIYLCHACNNGKCSNVKHLYWGTPTENVQDSKEAGTWSSIYDRTVKKHGVEYANSVRVRALDQSRYKNPGYSQEEIAKYLNAIKLSNEGTWGWVSRAAKSLNISHTQVRRFVNKYGSLM